MGGERVFGCLLWCLSRKGNLQFNLQVCQQFGVMRLKVVCACSCIVHESDILGANIDISVWQREGETGSDLLTPPPTNTTHNVSANGSIPVRLCLMFASPKN